MNLRKIQLWIIVLMILSLFPQGCVIPIDVSYLHDTPLAENVPKIVKGRTTKAEILEYFGPPDIEADGPNTKVSPKLLMFCVEGFEGDRERRIEEYRSLFPYSSIDDEHIAFLYEESSDRAKIFLVGLIATARITAYSNKLLIFINKSTELVDEFAYREEFKAPYNTPGNAYTVKRSSNKVFTTPNSRIYHLNDCKELAGLNVDKLVEFSSASEINNLGGKPCELCQP